MDENTLKLDALNKALESQLQQHAAYSANVAMYAAVVSLIDDMPEGEEKEQAQNQKARSEELLITERRAMREMSLWIEATKSAIAALQ